MNKLLTYVELIFHFRFLLIIGKNGRIYLNGDINEVSKAVDIIRFIINNSYKRGLTEKVKEILENK